MASRFLRADWHRACRLARPQKSVGGNSLSRQGVSGALSSASASRPSSGGVAFASPDRHSSQQLLWRACSTVARHSGDTADALGRPSTSSSSSRFGSVSSVTGLRYDGSWRGGWKGGLWASHHHQGHQQAGRRFLSNGRGQTGGQKAGKTNTNRSITADQVLLVLETKDGSKEHTLVSRQQALDAAEAANLDLVQVSGNRDPVVCRLMDFKREEYRKQKLKKAGARRVQKKKEIRLKGMIANHDFERKIKDVKKYLEKGDIVKVVLEANTSLLKRSGNCLNELQDNFEAEMEDFAGVVLKHSGRGNRYTRREIECIPKSVKAAKQPPVAAAAPPTPEGRSSSSSLHAATGEKEKAKPPPVTGVVDEELVRRILSGTVVAAKRGDGVDSSAPDRGGNATVGSEENSEENSGEDSSGDEERQEYLPGREGEAEEVPLKLKLGNVVISGEDLENYEDITEEAVKADEMAMDWERHQLRRQEDRRRRQNEAGDRRSADGYAKRGGGGGGGRKKWRAGDDSNGGGGGEAWSENLIGEDYESRRKSRVSGAGRGGQGGRPAARRGGVNVNAGGDSRARFTGRGRGRGDGGGGGGARGGGGGRSSSGRWEGGGERRGEGATTGRGGGRGVAPSAAPPVRTTPYKWRLSIEDGDENSGRRTAGAPAQQQQKQGRRWGGGSQNAVESAAGSRAAAAPPGGGGAAAAAAANDTGGEIRGFRARFGGGATEGRQQQAGANPSPKGSDPATSTAPPA